MAKKKTTKRKGTGKRPGRSSKGGHHLTKADVSKGGKNSKRRPYDAIQREWLNSKAGKAMLNSKIGKEICKKLGVDPAKATMDELFNLSLALQALRGDVSAIKESRDRAYGKAPQTVYVEDQKPDDLNLSKLSRKELDAFEKLLKKASK